jgi:hypothetical protein
MVFRVHQTGQQKAPQTHPTHERREEHTDGYRGGTEDEREHLEPENFVDQRGRAAADEEEQDARENHGAAIIVHELHGSPPTE